ncbi:hypothetical protein F5050DRAFT_1802939 [Lentinula boryana]|uniref:REJ domain-containing protein n=1 Tax=Lentinula boryana TaxID=40481 RepID=A0ABQ8QU02_9AGAR|nr:hypothetical protein F5050DRAFT_1802939 [Lentinula boryana]
MASSSLPASITTSTSVSDTGSSSFVSSSSVSDSTSLSTTSTTDTSTSASATSDSTSSSPTSSSSPSSTSSSSSSTPSSTSSSTDSTSTTILPPTSGSSSTSTSATPTSNTVSSSSSGTSSTSILTAPVTTVVQTTVVTTSDGQAFTTVFSTESTAPAGSTVIVGSDSADTSKSTSHTGAIVGGVVGGVVGLLLLILGALWFIRRRRRLQDDAFDGNFDPDRIVRPASGAGNLGGRGPTLPSIPVTNSDEHIGPRSPQMAEVEDDGMGGRLNGSAIGAGVVAPYPLHHPTTSPAHSATTPPPSARSWGNSSDAQHSMFNGHMPDWRGPSPGPSIPTQYTGSSGSGAPLSSYPPGMIGHLPPGASPGPAGAGLPPSAYVGATGSHGRRYSAGTSASSGDRQLLYAAGGPGSASSSTGGGSMHNSSRFAVANPDDGAYAGGFNEGKSAGGPPEPRPRDVLVHEDGGRLETNNDVTPEAEGPEEIPPTYDSLLGAAGMASGSRPEKRSQFVDESRI